MAPAKKATNDDSSSSSKTPGEKSAKANGKKAVTSHPNGAITALREHTNADPDDAAAHSSADNKGLSWATESLDNLQAYRYAYRLPNASPFSHPQHQALLTNPGIGQHSPTAVALKRKRAQQQAKKATTGASSSSSSSSSSSRQDLGNAVRRHFNAMPAEESAVIAGFLYKVQTRDKTFRLRSRPEKSKTSTT